MADGIFMVQNDFVTGTTIDVDGGWLLAEAIARELIADSETAHHDEAVCNGRLKSGRVAPGVHDGDDQCQAVIWPASTPRLNASGKRQTLFGAQLLQFGGQAETVKQPKIRTAARVSIFSPTIETTDVFEAFIDNGYTNNRIDQICVGGNVEEYASKGVMLCPTANSVT